MELPEIFKNKINIDQDDKYYRGAFNESHELKLPAKVVIVSVLLGILNLV